MLSILNLSCKSKRSQTQSNHNPTKLKLPVLYMKQNLRCHTQLRKQTLNILEIVRQEESLKQIPLFYEQKEKRHIKQKYQRKSTVYKITLKPPEKKQQILTDNETPRGYTRSSDFDDFPIFEYVYK
ncbi:hypothetical protein pb186bvf_010659 [Paramecium bursaria]